MRVRLKDSGEEFDALDPLGAFLQYLRGKVELVGDPLTVKMIEEEMQKLRPNISKEDVKTWSERADKMDDLREVIKPLLLELWRRKTCELDFKGYLELGDILTYLGKHPEIIRKQVQPNTVDARIRELANLEIETPPFFIRIGEGRTGHYALNYEWLKKNQLAPEAKV